jgi:hypothetical protein
MIVPEKWATRPNPVILMDPYIMFLRTRRQSKPSATTTSNLGTISSVTSSSEVVCN